MKKVLYCILATMMVIPINGMEKLLREESRRAEPTVAEAIDFERAAFSGDITAVKRFVEEHRVANLEKYIVQALFASISGNFQAWIGKKGCYEVFDYLLSLGIDPNSKRIIGNQAQADYTLAQWIQRWHDNNTAQPGVQRAEHRAAWRVETETWLARLNAVPHSSTPREVRRTDVEQERLPLSDTETRRSGAAAENEVEKKRSVGIHEKSPGSDLAEEDNEVSDSTETTVSTHTEASGEESSGASNKSEPEKDKKPTKKALAKKAASSAFTTHLVQIKNENETHRDKDEKAAQKIDRAKKKISKFTKSKDLKEYSEKKEKSKDKADDRRWEKHKKLTAALKKVFDTQAKEAQETFDRSERRRRATFNRKGSQARNQLQAGFDKKTRALRAQFDKQQADLRNAFKHAQDVLDKRHERDQARADKIYEAIQSASRTKQQKMGWAGLFTAWYM